MILTYEFRGKSYTINLELQADGTYLGVVDNRRYAVQVSQNVDGGLLLKIDGQRHLAYVAAQNNERFVHINGETYALAVPESRSRRLSAASGGGLTAQMPGQVIEVLVAEGDDVQSGQTLLIMEAMKMEIRVSAPQGGIIKQVRVQVGDVVDRGQQLVEIDRD